MSGWEQIGVAANVIALVVAFSAAVRWAVHTGHVLLDVWDSVTSLHDRDQRREEEVRELRRDMAVMARRLGLVEGKIDQLVDRG